MESLTYLADFGQCLPREALSLTPSKNQWHVVDYDAGRVKGRMITAQALVKPADVRLPLNVKGWHAVSVGFWPGMYCDSAIKYRLSNEEVFTVVHHSLDMKWDRIEIIETFPRYADLTGIDIVIGKDNSAHPPTNASIAYVKLERLTNEQITRIQADRQRTDTRRIIAINDGEGLFGGSCPRTKNELLEQVELYRHSDVGKVLWGVNLGDLTYYQSKVGRFCCAENEGVYPSWRQEYAAQSHKALAAAGVTLPFQEVMKHCHSMGLEFHTYYRLVIADHSHPHNIFSSDSFFVKEHPEWRMVAKDGTPMLKASYAFPQVRDFMVSLIEEGMQHDIDGVNLCFIRGPEYFGYEKPVIDDFMKLYGSDPRELPADDARLLGLRAGYMTEFVRAVRRAADKHGTRRGRKIQVSAWIEWSDERMQYFGYDSDSWIKEGLLDFILAIGPTDAIELAREKGCAVFGFGNSAWMSTPTESHIQDMKHCYASNLDGLALWDLNSVQSVPEKWAVLSRLGHKQEVMDWSPFPQHLPKMKRMRIVSIAGKDFTQTEYKNAPGAVPPEMLSAYTGG